MTSVLIIIVLDVSLSVNILFFFFNDAATTEIYTLPTRRSSDLSGPDQLAALGGVVAGRGLGQPAPGPARGQCGRRRDRKSTRLNSSHLGISYAVFCLKKKKLERQSLGRSLPDSLHDHIHRHPQS